MWLTILLIINYVYHMKRIDQEKIEGIIKEYKNNYSVKEIALQYNVSSTTVINYLTSAGLWVPRVKYKNNDTYFDEIDSAEKAYILGFLIADGCIRLEKRKNGNISKRICFSNSILDEEVIKYIHQKICPQTSLCYCHNKKGAKNRKPHITLQWTSNHMCNTLINKYHILPHKTNDINFEFPFETVPKEFYGSFILGFLDGDGYIGTNYIKFIATSKKFLLQLENIFKQFFEEHKDIIAPYCSRFYIETNKMTYYKYVIPLGKGRMKFVKKFLYEKTPIFLKRKYDKFNV